MVQTTDTCDYRVFVCTPEDSPKGLRNKLDLGIYGHEFVFEDIFSAYLEKSNRELNPKRFSEWWRTFESFFRMRFIQGLVKEYITIFPTITGITPSYMKKIAAKLKRKKVENKLVLVTSNSGKRIPIGNLHEIPKMQDSDLEKKLSKIGKTSIKTKKIPPEDVYSSLFRASDASKAPPDIREYIRYYLNELRRHYGKPKLKLHPRVSELALAYAKKMVFQEKAFTTLKKSRKEWTELMGYSHFKDEPLHKVLDAALSKIFDDRNKLKKLLKAKSHMGADVGVYPTDKGHRFAVCIRVK